MRCASCKHRWFEMGPEPDPVAAVPAIETPVVADEPPPPAQPITDAAADEDDDEPRRGHPVLKTLLALVLGAAFSAGSAAMWMKSLPPLDLSQLPWLQAVADPPPVPPSPLVVRFSVDPQPVAGGRILYTVSGGVTNPTDEPQTVPPLEGRLIGPTGTVDYRWTITVPGNALMLPGERFGFEASALGDAGARVVIAH